MTTETAKHLATISELPLIVRQKLPGDALLIFKAGYNEAAAGNQPENMALAAAWACVTRAGWERNAENPRAMYRRRKDTPDAGSVHLDVPISSFGRRGKRPRKPMAEMVKAGADPCSLYLSRPLTNGDALVAWAKDNGFATTVPAGEMHVTVAFSRAPIDWFKLGQSWADKVEVSQGGPRALARFGKAIVLRFAADELGWRHQQVLDAGGSSDFADYKPHVTLTYEGAGIDDATLNAIDPYQGPLKFGPEVFAEVNEDWADDITEKHDGADNTLQIVKVDAEQRIVYGWASVVTENGAAVVDKHEDIIEPHELEKAVTEFMLDARRMLLTDHARDAGGTINPDDQKGVVVHSMPVTKEIATALGIKTNREGWIVGVKVNDDEAWSDVKSGKLKSFSWGGRSQFHELEAA